MSDRDSEYRGPAIFSYGFRPFFLAAVLLGLCVIPVWLLIWRGVLMVDSPFTPTDWHVHEMVFGYASAAIAGFLFTAVPNWTGRKPVRGWPLAVLLGLGVGLPAVLGGGVVGAVNGVRHTRTVIPPPTEPPTTDRTTDAQD